MGASKENAFYLQGNGEIDRAQLLPQEMFLLREIRLAVLAGYLNHQILNRPLTEETRTMVSQMLQHIRELHNLQQQQSDTSANPDNTEARQHNSAEIIKTKKQITNLHKQIQLIQGVPVSQQEQFPPQGVYVYQQNQFPPQGVNVYQHNQFPPQGVNVYQHNQFPPQGINIYQHNQFPPQGIYFYHPSQFPQDPGVNQLIQRLQMMNYIHQLIQRQPQGSPTWNQGPKHNFPPW